MFLGQLEQALGGLVGLGDEIWTGRATTQPLDPRVLGRKPLCPHSRSRNAWQWVRTFLCITVAVRMDVIQHLVVEARDAAQYSPVQKNDLAPNVKSAEVQDPGAKQTHLLGSTAKQHISDSVVMTSVSRTGD